MPTTTRLQSPHLACRRCCLTTLPLQAASLRQNAQSTVQRLLREAQAAKAEAAQEADRVRSTCSALAASVCPRLVLNEAAGICRWQSCSTA